MRTLARLAALLLAAAAALAAPTAVHADTGGSRVYFVNGSVYTAPAKHAVRHTKLPQVKVPGFQRDDTYVQSVVPSPDGRHLAQVLSPDYHSHWVYVTDAQGRHAHPAFELHDPTSDLGDHWFLEGLSWRGEHRLYFSTRLAQSPSPDGDPQGYRGASVRTVHISRSGEAGKVTEVPGTQGLSAPATDPTHRRIAAVRVDAYTCAQGQPSSTTSTIVVLNLRTGRQHDLLTHASGAGDGGDGGACFSPMGSLAWSPDGSQIAFARGAQWRQYGLVTDELVLVAADGSDQDSPRVAVPYDGAHLVQSPTWQSPERLWFTQAVRHGDGEEQPGKKPDLFSAQILDGRGETRECEAHTGGMAEAAPSFG